MVNNRLMLAEIFLGVDYKILKESGNKKIYGELEYDSRKIKKGDIFIALKGAVVDGHKYIDKAVENGAIAVIISEEVELKYDIDYILVKDLRKNLGKIASNYYGRPEEKLTIVGITGTNGKTTTTYLVEQLLGEKEVARIGTVEYKIGDTIIEAPNTTPESLDIIKFSKMAVDKGIKYLIMEVSSHGLMSGRVDMLKFDVAIFTNLTPEHLDYHKDMESYFDAKRRLFLKVKDNKNCIINIDDEYGKRLYSEFGGLSYSLKSKADLDMETLNRYKSTLLGKFNMYNLLAGIGVTKLLGIGEGEIENKVKKLKGAPGRFEPVYAGQNFTAIVDYAHTGDALENILQGIKEINLKNGKIVTVFGCGGDRDRSKRKIMAEIAEKYSDYVIVTSDNPRTERPMDIIDEIVAGFKEDRYEVIENRENAIERAVEIVTDNDIILVAGKGHETYQIYGTEKTHFDDREVLKKVILKKINS